MTIYHGDARRLFGDLHEQVAVMLTDPPYGFEYVSNRPREKGNARSIAGDRGTFLRDMALSWWDDKPALVFGTRKVQAPVPSGSRWTRRTARRPPSAAHRKSSASPYER